MDLYIMRHGIAVDRGDPDFPNDDDRPLTPKGRKRLRAIARGLRSLEITPSVVLTSPLVRARETAEILTTSLRVVEDALIESELLTPDGSIDELVSYLADLEGRGPVLLVGHEPELSGLISRMLVGNDSLDVVLKKGAVAHLEWDPPGRAMLRFLMQPAQLRHVAGLHDLG